MRKSLWMIAAPGIGIFIISCGFVYDVLFAGIPYQDPTPELHAQYEFHRSIAAWFYKAGGLLLLTGLVSIPMIFKKTRRTFESAVSEAA